MLLSIALPLFVRPPKVTADVAPSGQAQVSPA